MPPFLQSPDFLLALLSFRLLQFLQLQLAVSLVFIFYPFLLFNCLCFVRTIIILHTVGLVGNMHVCLICCVQKKIVFYLDIRYITVRCRGVAQPGRVLAWGARGRRFDSCHPDHEIK